MAQLHQWEADEHPHLGDPGNPSRGNGVLLWFARRLREPGGQAGVISDVRLEYDTEVRCVVTLRGLHG